MPETNEPGDYRRIGLIANPFATTDDESGDSVGVQLAFESTKYSLLTALDRAIADPDHRPVFVRKRDLPASYHLRPFAGVLSALASDTYGLGVLSLYVPLDMFKLGRVRAVLSALAERVAGVGPDLTLGLWTHKALVEPDQSLVEWAFISESADIASIQEEFAADPSAAAQRVYGSVVQSRDGAEDLEMLMRVSFSRQDRLDVDPAEGEEGLKESENPSDDPMLEVFTTQLGEVDGRALEAADDEDGPNIDKLLADYVVAYTRENLSPVIARAIRAYMAQGTASMAQELKVSKAPTKTLVSLMKFVQTRYRGVVVLYDRIEMWEAMPHELRMKIISTFSSLRWALKDHAVLCFTAQLGVAPELEETFASATQVEWDFFGIENIQAMDAPFDVDVARRWVASASLSGEVPDWAEELISGVPDGAQLAVATAALADVIDDAVSRSETPSTSALLTALEETPEAPAT